MAALRSARVNTECAKGERGWPSMASVTNSSACACICRYNRSVVSKRSKAALTASVGPQMGESDSAPPLMG